MVYALNLREDLLSHPVYRHVMSSNGLHVIACLILHNTPAEPYPDLYYQHRSGTFMDCKYFRDV